MDDPASRAERTKCDETEDKLPPSINPPPLCVCERE